MTCYVLDTDHLSLYERGHPQICRRILQSRQQVSERLATTVITIEDWITVCKLMSISEVFDKQAFG